MPRTALGDVEHFVLVALRRPGEKCRIHKTPAARLRPWRAAR
jgi:hypothetical protein